MSTIPKRTPDAVLERLKSLHPKVIDLALERVESLLSALDHPERDLPPTVHIAGTNAKGSTVANLRAMAEAAGRRVQAYTSPHLVRFAERIYLPGGVIADDALTALLEECERRNGGRAITFFEITTAAAFLAFSRTPADLCLLETGLGGRFDATNVLKKPALTILTPISADHQAFLGDSIAAIAGEKAGILKAGVPCVCSAQPADALAVIETQAAALKAPLHLQDRDWTVSETKQGIQVVFGDRRLDLPRPALIGPHQIGNAGLAAAAACLLSLPEAAIAEGLHTARWPARMQRLTEGPLVKSLPPEGWELWLDGGHNPAAGEALAAMAGRCWADRPLYGVAGMLNSKDSRGFFAPLRPWLRDLRTLAIPGESNSVSAEDLAAAARAQGIAAAPAPSLAQAVAELARRPGSGRILICGSLYLAGQVLAENG